MAIDSFLKYMMVVLFTIFLQCILYLNIEINQLDDTADYKINSR